MRVAKSPMHSGARLLRVHPVLSSEDLKVGENSFFRILWLANPSKNDDGQMYILPPDKSLDMGFDSDGTAYLISFPEEILLMTGCQGYHPFTSTQSKFWDHAKPTLVQEGTGIGRMILDLASEYQCAHYAGDMLIGGLLKVLFISIARLYPQSAPPVSNCNDRQLFQRFIRLVSDRSAGRKTIHDYACALSVKTEILTECVRKVSGYPASHHIYEHITSVAKHAAISSGASMKEVAYGLGFSDMAHFSKFFQNRTGMTFSNYRRAYQTL